MGYKVTAPYVTVRVKDDLGSDVVREFYTGGVLPEDTHEDDIEKLARKGMIAEQGTPEADAATPVGRPVQFDEGGMPMSSAQVAAAEEKRAARPTPRPAPRAPEKGRTAENKG